MKDKKDKNNNLTGLIASKLYFDWKSVIDRLSNTLLYRNSLYTQRKSNSKKNS